MFQDYFFDDGHKKTPKLTSSNDQFVKVYSLADELPQRNTIPVRKVMSLNSNRINANLKGVNDVKAFNAKYNVYKNTKKMFANMCDDLIKSYEPIKRLQMELSLPKKKSLELEEIDTVVKNIVENKFGIKFPKSKKLFKKKHQLFIPNLVVPLKFDLNATSGHQKLDLEIKKTYENVWRKIIDISETNMKYHFLLKKILEPGEFFDLFDVREYLIQNMFNKEKLATNFELNLKNLYNDLQLKLINIIYKVDEIFKPKNEYTTIEQKQMNKNNNEDQFEKLPTKMSAEMKHLIIMKEHKSNTDKKIKRLEEENEKLKKNECECSKQVNALIGELTFRNRKLASTKNHLELLIAEKNDLIFTIKKMEIKEEGFQTLQNRFKKEQDKNRRLRAIISKLYDNKDEQTLY